jgi:hypothetical protein
MSELQTEIAEGLQGLIYYDYDDNEKTVEIYGVFIHNNKALTSLVNIIDILSKKHIETLEQKVFDSYDKELKEPERE